MKIKILSLLVLIIACSFTGVQTKKRILFFGDSITEMGVKPNGYITRLQELFAQKGLDKQYELMGAGIGGFCR